MADYLDPRTGQTFPLDQPRWCGTDQAPLLLTPLPGIVRAQIDTTERSLWRYRAALPFPSAEPITLGEGMHALCSAACSMARPFWLKCDWMKPDRQLQGPRRERHAVAAARPGL